MIWPQQYHKEKQREWRQYEAEQLHVMLDRLGLVSPEEEISLVRGVLRWLVVEAVGPAASPSQPVEASGEQPRCPACAAQIKDVRFHRPGCLYRETLAQTGYKVEDEDAEWMNASLGPVPQQPEAPAAEQWRRWRALGSRLVRTSVNGNLGGAEDDFACLNPSVAIGLAAQLNADFDALKRSLTQRVLDVNPESPTDATRGVGETGQWRVEQFDDYGLIKGSVGYGLTDGQYHIFLEVDKNPDWHPNGEDFAKQHAKYLNSHSVRGVGDDPIPQRECEHVWTPVMRDLNYDLAVCSRGGCGGARLNGKVLLPQPIDPRSEA